MRFAQFLILIGFASGESLYSVPKRKGLIYVTIKTMPVGPIGTNCYLLGDADAGVCAMVDPGGDGEAILAMIREAGLTLTAILLTHGHYDHTGAVEDLEKAFPNTPVYIHRADAEGVHPTMFPPLPKEQVRFYGEGDTVQVGGLAVEVLHTPGHSKGSVVLKVGDVLFTGDTLFRGSCGRTDLPGGSYEEIMTSLARLGGLTGDYRVCPGHEGLSTLEAERKQNYYLREALGG